MQVGTEEGVERRATKADVAYAVADVTAWRSRPAAGVEVIDTIAILGYERLEFRDPFGNRVEIIAAAEYPVQPRRGASPGVCRVAIEALFPSGGAA